MQWLGLDWDEGPYFQSQRGPLYAEAIEKLLASGAAYACDCPPDGGGRAGPASGAARPPATTATAGTGAWSRFRAAWCGSGRPTTGRPASTTSIRGTVTVDNADDRGLRDAQVQRRPPLHPGQRRRRRRHADHPRHPRRGPRHQHHQVRAAVGGPRLRAAARSSPTCRCSQRRPQEAVQAPGQGGGRGLPGRGLSARGDAQLSGPAGLVPRRQPGDPDPRRDGRRVPPRGRQERGRHLRRAQAAGGQRRVPAGAPAVRVGRAVPGLAARPGGSRWLRRCRSGPAPWPTSTP